MRLSNAFLRGRPRRRGNIVKRCRRRTEVHSEGGSAIHKACQGNRGRRSEQTAHDTHHEHPKAWFQELGKLAKDPVALRKAATND